MNPIFKTLKPSETLKISAKAKELAKKGLDVINLSAGEPDFDTPQYIKDAIKKALDNSKTKYTPATGIKELKEVISEKFKKENSLEYPPDNIIISCGAKHVLFNILFCLLEKNDKVLIISPYWVSYPAQIILCRGTPVILETEFEDKFDIDLEEFRRKVKGCKAVIINTPSNPTGKILKREILEKIAKVCLEEKVYIISDEIYEKIVFESEHFSIGSVSKEILKITFTVNGVSKSFSMTGLRIGWCGAPILVKELSVLQSHTTSNPTSISQYGALEALSNPLCRDFYEFIRKEFKERRDVFCRELEKIDKLEVFVPEGAFYVFCKIKNTGLSSSEFCEKLLEKELVSCVPGVVFGKEGFIRFSLSQSRERLKEAAARIKNFIASL